MKVTLTTQEILAKFGLPTDTELVIEPIKTKPSEWVSNVGRDSYGHPESLDPNTEIEVKFNNGETDTDRASAWVHGWKETNKNAFSIVAYQVI